MNKSSVEVRGTFANSRVPGRGDIRNSGWCTAIVGSGCWSDLLHMRRERKYTLSTKSLVWCTSLKMTIMPGNVQFKSMLILCAAQILCPEKPRHKTRGH